MTGATTFTLRHCCRSGKSLQAFVALTGAVRDGVELRAQQRRALDKMGRLPGLEHCCSAGAAPELGVMAFSSTAVLRQFHADYLVGQDGIWVVYVCSASRDDGGVATTDPDRVLELMVEARRRRTPAVFLTLYESLSRVVWRAAERLGAVADLPPHQRRVDVAVFDEAHNLHTETRKEFYTEVDRLDRLFPVRLYMTATPRDEMLDGEHTGVYGDPDDVDRWDTFEYADALQAQRDDPTLPEMVKTLRVKVLINGCTAQRAEARDPEFYDVVAVLREIAEARQRGGAVHRVKVYNKKAREGVRSSLHFVEQARWEEALAYLHGLGEARNLAARDLAVRNVDGTMTRQWSDDQSEERQTVLDSELGWFNAPVDEKTSEVRILLSCQVFREGVTLRRVDLTVFADGKGSTRDIIQSGLRGARADPEHPGRSLDVLLLVNAANEDGTPLSETGMPDGRAAHDCIHAALVSRKGFDTIAQVLGALMELDPQVRSDFEAQTAKSSGGGNPTTIGNATGGDSTSATGSDHAFQLRVQRELLPPDGAVFRWHEDALADLEAHLLHSAAIHIRHRNRANLDAHYSRLAMFATVVDKLNTGRDLGASIVIPAHDKRSDLYYEFPDKTSMATWWSDATKATGVINKSMQFQRAVEQHPVLRKLLLFSKLEQFVAVVSKLNVVNMSSYQAGCFIVPTHEKFSDQTRMRPWWSTQAKKFVQNCPDFRAAVEKHAILLKIMERSWPRQRQCRENNRESVRRYYVKNKTKVARQKLLTRISQGSHPQDATLDKYGITYEMINKIRRDNDLPPLAPRFADSSDVVSTGVARLTNNESDLVPCTRSKKSNASASTGATSAEDDDASTSTTDRRIAKRQRTSGSNAASPNSDTTCESSSRSSSLPAAEYGENHTGEHRAWKVEMNDEFGRAVCKYTGGDSMVLVLDDDNEPEGGFGTSRRLVERHGLRPEQLRVVQSVGDKARRMAADPRFGSRVAHSDVAEHLATTGERYRAAYLDLCGTWGAHLRPALEALLREGGPMSGPTFVLGVTWCTRDPSGQTADNAEVELHNMLMMHRVLHKDCHEAVRTRFYEITLS